MNFEKVVIVGASGYSGEELVRLLARHSVIAIEAVTSREHAGKSLSAVYPRFNGTRYADLPFIPSTVDAILATEAGFVFLALPHGVAAEFAAPLVQAGRRVLDLSADFRIKNLATYADYYGAVHPAPELAAQSVYGLPEVYRSAIESANLVACPGCYPTSILLPLLPLLRHKLLHPQSLCISSLSGVSGAGRTVRAEFLFAECNESVRAYGVAKHRHLAEIEQELSLAASESVIVQFTPHLVPTNRGIHTTIYAAPADGVQPSDFTRIYQETYGSARFVRLLGESGPLPDTKVVVGSNFLDLAWRHDPRTGRIIILSAEDNLIKGAAGQAVQCLNLMGGWPEETALL